MSVFAIVSIIFLEILTAVIAASAAFVLAKEHGERRTSHLAYFATSFAVASACFFSLFIAQVFAGHGHEASAVFAHRGSLALMALGTFFGVLGLVRIYRGAKYGLLDGLAGASLVLSLVAVVVVDAPLTSVAGVTFLFLRPEHLIAMQSVYILSLTFLLALPGKVLAQKPKTDTPVSALFFAAGIFGLLFIAVSVAGAALKLQLAAPFSLLAICCSAACLITASLAADHPDAEVRKKPFTLFSRSLVFKSVGLNTLVMWALALFLLGLTSAYFVSLNLRNRETGLRRDLLYFSKSYAGSGLQLLADAAKIADSDEVASLLAGQPDASDLDGLVNRTFGKAVIGRGVRVVGADGHVLYSTKPDEEGAPLSPSRVLERALLGTETAAIEKDENFNVWVLRAAVPVRHADGTVIAIVLATHVDIIFDFSDYNELSPIEAVGYGFVSEHGEHVYSVGASVDAVTRTTLLRAIGRFPSATHRTDDSVYFEQRVYSTDGAPNGFFYIFLTREVLDREAFRVIATVTIFSVLAMIIVNVILLFGMSVVLRPLRDLQEAARRIETEEYGKRIEYSSPDELGRLAAAFNHMQDTIEDRTVRLKAALREQQDALDNTMRELRTPLSIFRWTLEMMRYGDTGKLNKEQLELVEQLHQTNERVFRLVQNFQDAMRIERRRLVLNLVETAVEDVIDEAAGNVAVTSRQKNIVLHWKRPETPLRRAWADRTYLLKIIENLLSNAVKYTGGNGHVEVTVEESGRSSPNGREGKFLLVSVEDNGMGIPKDDQPRVFSRFFRGRQAMEGDVEGAGLGLYITKQLVELHGGEMWFRSKEGVGTTFSFTIPADRPLPDDAIDTPHSPPRT